MRALNMRNRRAGEGKGWTDRARRIGRRGWDSESRGTGVFVRIDRIEKVRIAPDAIFLDTSAAMSPLDIDMVVIYFATMATIIEAIGRASATHGWVAARPTGIMLRVVGLGRLHKIVGDHSQPWVPSVLDLVADDWEAAPLAVAQQALLAVGRTQGAS